MRDGAWGSGTSSPDDGSGRTKAAADEPTDLMELREGVQGAGEVADNGGTPGDHEPSEALYDAARDSIHVHVDPGGSTFTERNGSVAHESAGAETDGEVVRATRLRGKTEGVGAWTVDDEGCSSRSAPRRDRKRRTRESPRASTATRQTHTATKHTFERRARGGEDISHELRRKTYRQRSARVGNTKP